MSDEPKLFLFGDQTYDNQPYRKELLRDRQNPILENFLSKSYDVIRKEIFTLPVEVIESLPRFTSLDDLLLWKQDGQQCIPVDMAMTCLYQIGTFISQSSSWDFYSKGSGVVGLCTGALAAAAVVCTRNTLDLVPIGVDAVLVAFRTGMRVADMAQRLDPSESLSQSWSFVIPGLTSAEAVHKYCEQTRLPLSFKPYISAYAPNGITVSGPPRSLSLLHSSQTLQTPGVKSIPIFGPYHAPHLYSQDDVDEIIGTVGPFSSNSYKNVIPIFSSGGRLENMDFGGLLNIAVAQILLHPIQWNNIIEKLQNHISSGDPRSFSIIPIATRSHQLIYSALKQTPLRTLLPSMTAQNKSPGDVPGTGEYASPGKPKLAIVGMSGRFPGAKDNDAFWKVLHGGLDMHKIVPPSRWDVKSHVDPEGKRKNTSTVPLGAWLDDPASFDARFFNISPREAPQIDPAQRLALMTAYEAVEQAGIVPDATPSTRRDRVGVFYGVTSQDWFETNSAQNIDTYFIPGGNMAFIPGRINYFFKFSGPSYAVNTACSSSLAGIHLACNSLWRGDIDTAIAGGTNVLTNPDMTAGLDKGHFLSRTGNCKTFDDEADGYCRGEGVGTIILKRLDDAVADEDPILGVILGAYTNHSAESESITRPHVGAQKDIFRKILNQSATDPYSVGYIEMHGTGTQAGDAGEMSSVLDIFAPSLTDLQKGRNKTEALFLGSAKANIGHGEAASGMASLIKVLLMLQKNMIVPHCGIKNNINRKFPTDMTQRNVHIAREPTSWERSSDALKPRRVFVNNFSAAGGNSALLLEDAPYEQESASVSLDFRSHHVVAVSAKNAVSLQGNLRSLRHYLQQNSSLDIGQLSYTTTGRRIHHPHRVMLTGVTTQDLCSQIEEAIQKQTGVTRPKSTPKIIFMFTGQGAQYPGMGKELYESFSLFRTEMRRLDRIVESLGFQSMLPVINSIESDVGAFDPVAVQLASVCLQVALTKLWASWNITPAAVVGHSLGEYAALNAAGVLSDADMIYLVGSRATMLQEKCTRDTHSMLVVKASVNEIAHVLKGETYETACINSPTETVLAGINDDISRIKNTLSTAGLKTTLLKVPYAFHSSQVEPILVDYQQLAKGVTFYQAKVAVICPLDGSIVDGFDKFGPEYLARHTREPVNMHKALLAANSHHIIGDQSTALEIGPHPAITGMVKAVLNSQITCLASLQRGRPAFQLLTASLKALYTAGSNIRWSAYHADFKASHKVLALPAYSWDLKPYWIQYVNDWSLRKGDPPAQTSKTSRLESTTIHRVVKETYDSKGACMIVEADATRKDFRPLVEGHEVDGVPLCTPAVYADIALSLGTHLLECYHPNKKPDTILNISDMTIVKALILRADGPEQILQVHADADWASNVAIVKFMTFDKQQKLQEHSRCNVQFTDRSLQNKLQKEMVEIKQKQQILREGISTGETARFNRAMVYRAIRPLARFHDDYRAVDEIVLNSKTLESSSRLSFGGFHKEGNFHTHPGLLDALTWSSGFTMNCNDNNDLDKEVFVNHGWGSFRMFEALDLSKIYTTYSRMVEGKDHLWHGEIVIMENDRVVAHFGQFAMQGVPRRVLRIILSTESRQNAKKPHQQQPQPAEKTEVPALALSKALGNASQHHAESKTKPSDSIGFDQAISIIAEESGLAVADFTDDTIFGDAGVDSLLGLTISARFKEDLDMDLDINALFYEYSTVGDLKNFLAVGNSKTAETSNGTSETESIPPSLNGSSDATGATTPITRVDTPGPVTNVDYKHALHIISEESGISVDELTDDTNFGDAGVDSLLSLVIVSRFRDELELDIQHESLFLECPTVADLKKMLVGAAPEPVQTISEIPTVNGTKRQETEKSATKVEAKPALQLSENEMADLVARKRAIDEYVEKYTAGFSAPVLSSRDSAASDNDKVVLVTGATGSLGGHLAFKMAHLSDVKMVICLNREHRVEAFERQKRAMKDKGVHFPDHLLSKLKVLQADTSQAKLGLSNDEYERLVASVTHIIHQAWPMSVKRPLSGFEPQFGVMRNLIDMACLVTAQRPRGFRFGFQLISSISVVGNYGHGTYDEGMKVLVPEERVNIDALLPVGYAEAKWGCERMLDETLHKHSNLFRPMTVRLGQIAGSSVSGYWNPMEHFGFMIKSSQTLNALPDVDGTAYWTPVNEIAGTLCDLVLSSRDPQPVYHIENPVGQSWQEINAILADALNIPKSNMIPLREWTERVKAAPVRDNPASALADFLESNYKRMSCGGLVLDAQKALQDSPTLAAVGPVSTEVIRKYITVWKTIGFLKN
ncbi:hypothetical protein TruAng_004913 [Truncatella angustata]|nr:hypothetical protein TruAng_004913 [Truncatella angustata]